MKQTLNKLVKQKTTINGDIGKIFYNIEIYDEEISRINREIKTIKRAVRSRKSKIKFYDDISLSISELKKSLIYYENDINLLKIEI